MIKHSQKNIFCQHLRESPSRVGKRDLRRSERVNGAIFIATNAEAVQPFELLTVFHLVGDKGLRDPWQAPDRQHVVGVSFFFRKCEVFLFRLDRRVGGRMGLEGARDPTGEVSHVPMWHYDEEELHWLAFSALCFHVFILKFKKVLYKKMMQKFLMI